MGFFQDLGNDVTTIATVGQCNTSGCGGSHRDTALGNSLTNTATLGQCDGSGCGSGHTGSWAPLGVVSAVFGAGGPSADQQQQMMQIIELGGAVLLGIVALNLLLDLL
jgi:hypothetical protein